MQCGWALCPWPTPPLVLGRTVPGLRPLRAPRGEKVLATLPGGGVWPCVCPEMGRCVQRHVLLGHQAGVTGRQSRPCSLSLCGGSPWGSVPEGAQHVPPRRDPRAPSGLTKAKCPQGSNIVVNSVHTPFSIEPRKEVAFRARMGCESLGFHLRACLVPFHPQERKGYQSLTQLRAVGTAKLGLFS